MPKVPVKPDGSSSEQAPAEEALAPYSVILDGVDVTIFAKDQADLQKRIAKRRALPST